MKTNLHNYPEGMGPESATYALDGPKEQQVRTLRNIIAECDLMDSEEAKALGSEAAEYLSEIEA